MAVLAMAQAHQELLLGDELGFVYVWNVAAEECLKCERLHEGGAAIRDLSMRRDELLVSRAASCDFWLLVREQQYSETKGHTAAVIALGVHEATGDATAGEEAVYSASLDNSIRAWRPSDMSPLGVLHETRSEISCMLQSPLCAFLLTGNDDGTIRLWNPDSGTTVTLTGHTNTVCCLDVVVCSPRILRAAAWICGVAAWMCLVAAWMRRVAASST